jgi:hypothetical protein
MAKLPTKAKSNPKNETKYVLTVPFIEDCTIEERDAILRRALIIEQNKYEKKPFRFIITEKTMKQAKVNIFVKKPGKSKKK